VEEEPDGSPVSVGADGIAMIASSESEFPRMDATFAIGPRTGIESIVEPINSLSSSRKAFTLPKIFFLLISSAMVCPAKPAPMI